jgi:DNA-binding HxlR family transcriptional regulator
LADLGNNIIEGLYRRRWALPALAVLERTRGPYRQANLLADLVATSGSMVHSRTFASAMTYLVDNHLAVRHEQPGLVAYEITDTGRKLHARLADLDRAFGNTAPPGDQARRTPDPV